MCESCAGESGISFSSFEGNRGRSYSLRLDNEPLHHKVLTCHTCFFSEERTVYMAASTHLA